MFRCLHKIILNTTSMVPNFLLDYSSKGLLQKAMCAFLKKKKMQYRRMDICLFILPRSVIHPHTYL